MTTKELAFLTELKALLANHGVELKRWDRWDGQENYIGTEYGIKGEEVNLSLKAIGDALGIDHW